MLMEVWRLTFERRFEPLLQGALNAGKVIQSKGRIFLDFEYSTDYCAVRSMDINDIKQISSAYRQLHSYSEFGTMITQKVIAMDSQTKILDVVGILEMLTNDFLNNEKHLMNDLDKTIAKLKEEN